MTTFLLKAKGCQLKVLSLRICLVYINIVYTEVSKCTGALSACPGGDCGSEHSSDVAKCYPLKVSIWDVDPKFIKGINPSTLSNYNRNHGIE